MLSLIVTVIVLVIIWDYLIKKRATDLTSGIPGLTPIPIIGTEKIFKIRSIRDIEEQVTIHHKKYGPIIRIFIFNRLCFMISRPDLVECILGSPKHTKKIYFYNVLSVWLGNGLLTAPPKLWHGRRKALTPALHFQMLEKFIKVFDQQSKIFVEKLKVHSNTGKDFDVSPYLGRLTLDIMCETSMGVKLNAQSDLYCKFAIAATEVIETIMHRISYHYLVFDPIFKLFGGNIKKRQDAALKILDEYSDRVIQERYEYLKKTIGIEEEKGSQEEQLGIKKQRSLLDILLQSNIDGKPLSNQDIRDEVNTFMFAGHDTTKTALSYTLYLLSRHPAVQQKVVEEIREVIGKDSNDPLTYHRLQELKYTECVIKEAMRIYTVSPAIGRELIEDAVVGGHTIPAGSQILIPIFLMMKNPEIFPNPEIFDPNRHIIDDTKPKMNPYSYIPFSAGPRNCIGQKFAMMESKCVLCNVLRSYELLPLGDEPKVLISVILQSENGVNIGLKERMF